MSDKRSSMREGPLSELFRPTTDTPAPAAPAEETPAWGREAPATFGTERSNYLAVIKCVGVGGAGVNAIDRMIEAGIRGVEFIAVNTDRQSLDATEADVRIPVGIESTRGRGTGGNAAMAEQAMRESEEQLRRALRGADLVFIAAGEGGGTGTGGAPIIAKLAREMGALTIAVVTRPFAFEGNRRLQMAEAGINALRDQADTIIVIQNDRLLSVLDKNVSMVNAFRVCDDLLRQGVQGITDLITLPGLINLDFADVRTVIRGAGSALLGIGYASGPQRAEEAALAAISSPLLETPIDGARGILLGITGGSDLSLSEISRAAKVVSDAADPEANIIFGATVDPELEGKVWVTVVAAGFTGRRAAPSRSAADLVRPAFGARSEQPQAAPPAAAPTAAPTPPTPIGNAPSASTPIFPPLSPAPVSTEPARPVPGGPGLFDQDDPPPITPIAEPVPPTADAPSPPAEVAAPAADEIGSVAPPVDVAPATDVDRTVVIPATPADPPATAEPPKTPSSSVPLFPPLPVEPVFQEPASPQEPPEAPDFSAIDDAGRETALEEAAAREDLPPGVKELFGSRADDLPTELFRRPTEDDEPDRP
jgi:cell division protein FtsZ